MKKRVDIHKALGDRLRALRKERELTQQELADQAGMNGRYYAMVERGQKNVSLETMKKIADGLGVDVCELFRFPKTRELSEADQEILALVDRVLTKGAKTKKRVRVILEELVR